MKPVHHIQARFHKTDLSSTGRNTGLDILRALCVIIVVLAHTNNLLGKYTGVYKAISPLMLLAQEVFFSLSGFLVGNQILRLAEKKPGIAGLAVFFKRRWLRTVPLYFFFLVLNYFLFIYLYNPSEISFLKADFEYWKYFFFIQNLHSSHPYFYPEIWPLGVEEWSYLLMPVPLIVLFIATGKVSHRYLGILLLLCVGMISFFRIRYVLEFLPEQDWQLRKITTYRLDALLYGFIMAIVLKSKPGFFSGNSKILFAVSLMIAVFTCWISFKYRHPYINSVLFTILPLVTSLMLPYFVVESFRNTSLNRLFTHVSLISYTVLLSHLYCLQFLFFTLFKPADFSSSLLVTAIYLPVLVIFATWFYNKVERPFLLMRQPE